MDGGRRGGERGVTIMKRIFIVLLGTACVLGPTAGFARDGFAHGWWTRDLVEAPLCGILGCSPQWHRRYPRMKAAFRPRSRRPRSHRSSTDPCRRRRPRCKRFSRSVLAMSSMRLARAPSLIAAAAVATWARTRRVRRARREAQSALASGVAGNCEGRGRD